MIRLFNLNMNNDQKFRTLNKLFADPHTLLHGMAIYLELTFLSLMFGYVFLLFMLSFIHGIFWLAPYWEPAYKLFTKALNVPSSDQEFNGIPLTWWRVIALCLKIGLIIYCFFIGFKLLQTHGFLNQNIIYVILKY